MQALPAVRSANVFGLAKAMPKQVEMPNVILQLNQLASASGITFDQVTPTAAGSTPSTALTTADTTDPFAAQAIQVTFTGSFYNMISFLQRLRNLVRVEHGHLQAQGRLFDVSDVEFCLPNNKASTCTTQPPQQVNVPVSGAMVHVTLTINALVPQQVQSATAPGSTDTTSTTTTTTGTTTTTSNSTSAAPSTSGGTS
jgi:hypothetical protein